MANPRILFFIFLFSSVLLAAQQECSCYLKYNATFRDKKQLLDSCCNFSTFEVWDDELVLLDAYPKLQSKTNKLTIRLYKDSLFSIPASLASFRELEELVLELGKTQISWNELFDRLQQLPKLKTLSINSYHKPAALPVDKLKQLTELRITDTPLDSVPEKVFACKQLQQIHLRYCRISYCDKRIASLKKLTVINLQGNKLKEFPAEAAMLPDLRELDLSFNQISSFDLSKGNYTSLQKLVLSRNNIDSLPHAITQLKQLRNFEIRNNKIRFLPAGISQWQQLRTLDLSNNQLQELPQETGKLEELYKLLLQNNQLKNLPDSLCRLTKMLDLNVCNNPFETVPKLVKWYSDFVRRNMPRYAMERKQMIELSDNSRLELRYKSEKKYYETRKIVFMREILKNLVLLYDCYDCPLPINFQQDCDPSDTLTFIPGDSLAAVYDFRKKTVELSWYLRLYPSLKPGTDSAQWLLMRDWDYDYATDFSGWMTALDSITVDHVVHFDAAKMLMELSASKNIQTIRIKSSGLMKVPQELLNFQELREIDLSDNPIDELPEWLLQLPALKKVVLSKALQPKVPDEFRKRKVKVQLI